MLDAMHEVCPEARVYQAPSSEMFGKVGQGPQNEFMPFCLRSPYGIGKVYRHFIKSTTASLTTGTHPAGSSSTMNRRAGGSSS